MTSAGQESIWLQRYGAYQAEAPLRGERRVDVAIIGGGFTGLSAAWHLRQAEAPPEVAVLEAEHIGFGASGRNGGFSMALFGLDPTLTRRLFGVERAREADAYMRQAVAYVQQLVTDQGLASDYRHPGFLRVATTLAQLARLEHELEQLQRMGMGQDFEWREAAELREAFPYSPFLAGLYEPEAGLLDPARHVRALKRIAMAAGAQIHEVSPVLRIERGQHIVLHGEQGSLRAQRLVIATNAWTHQLRGLRGARSRQQPVWTHQIATRQLRREEWAAIGWKGGEGIEDARNLIHYFRPTVDGRITMGGGNIQVTCGSGMAHDAHPASWEALERSLRRLFPPLRGVDIACRWGGPVSVTLDMVPVIGYLGDERVIYSCGCMGHGVSLSQYNGRTIAELLLERLSERTAVWFVQRRPLPWPPEPFSCLGKHAVRAGLRLHDRWLDRGRSVPDAPAPGA